MTIFMQFKGKELKATAKKTASGRKKHQKMTAKKTASGRKKRQKK